MEGGRVGRERKGEEGGGRGKGEGREGEVKEK